MDSLSVNVIRQSGRSPLNIMLGEKAAFPRPSLLPWNKAQADAWEAQAETFALHNPRSPGAFLAHPVSSIRWARFEEDEEGSVRSWRYVNSAQRARALPVDWSNVYRLAALMDASEVDSPVEVEVLHETMALPRSMPRVANIASLERTLAAALASRYVIAAEMPLAIVSRGVAGPPPTGCSPAEGLRLDAMVRSRVGAELQAAPSVVWLSRDTRPVCWPKAWHFAQLYARGAGADLPAVPVSWSTDRSRWESQHRHRVLGALVSSADLKVVMAADHDLGGGATWRLPSKSRLKLASRAATLLAVACEEPHPKHSALLQAAREALTKAPQECAALGVAEGLRAVILRREDAKAAKAGKAAKAAGAAKVAGVPAKEVEAVAEKAIKAAANAELDASSQAPACPPAASSSPARQGYGQSERTM